jgi:tetratricopeptide (TPR) repeat protein
MNAFHKILVSLFNPNTLAMKNFLALVVISFTVGHSFAQTDSAEFFYQKGNEEKTARLFKPALAHYQKSVQFNPNNVDAQRDLGIVAMELRRYDLALSAFEKVLTLQKNDPVAIENLTNIYFWTRKWNEAIQSAHIAQQLHIGTRNNFIIAKSYYEQENYGEALKFLELAYRDDPKNPEIQYLGGRSYVEMSNYKKAFGCYEQALALDSSKVNWIYEAGMVAYAIPDDKKAIYYLKKLQKKG